MCIYAAREGDYVLFHHEGGVDVGDVDAKAQKLLVGVDKKLSSEDVREHLLVHVPADKKELSAPASRHLRSSPGSSLPLQWLGVTSRGQLLGGSGHGSGLSCS